MKTIVAISGSLRVNSANTTLLKLLGTMFPADVQYTLFEGIGDLPHFNPDIDKGEALLTVMNFRDHMQKADAVVICTPEYAFGVPGVLKNALDWLVSSGELNEKRVATISASPLFRGGDRAHASLLLTLEALGVKKSGELTIPAITTKLDETGRVKDEETKRLMQSLAEQVLTNIL